MIDILKNKLQNWFDWSCLTGLYLIGSRSINEDNSFSDIDLFGLSQNELSSEDIIIKRRKLKEELSDLQPLVKIGFRIRAVSELKSFQSKLKSWGYDLLCSKRLFGVELREFLPRTDSIGFNHELVFNNIIELLWYNQLCLNGTISKSARDYICAKSTLNVGNLILYENEIFFPGVRERIAYLSDNESLMDAVSISADDLLKCYQIKRHPEKNDYHIDFDKLRHVIIKETYMKFSPSFALKKNSFSNHDYWNYSSSVWNPINQICKMVGLKVESNSANPYYLWRIVFIELLLKLDSIRLNNNQDSLFSSIEELIWLLVKEGNIRIEKQNDKTALDLLMKLEFLRLQVSETKKDSGRLI